MPKQTERNRKGPSDEAAHERGGGPGRTAWKRIAVAVGSLVAVVTLVYAGAALFLQSVLDPATLARWVEPRLEASLNRDVRLGGASVDVFPRLSLELRDLVVADPAAPPEGDDLAAVDRVSLDVRLLPLLRRRVRIHRVRIERPTVRLRRFSDGSTNYGDLVPEGEATGETRPSALDLEIRDLRLVDGTLSWRDLERDREVRVEEIEAAAGLEGEGEDTWRVELSATAARTAVVLGEARPLDGVTSSLELTGSAARDFASVTVEGGRVRVGQMELEVEGSIERFREPVRRLALRLRSDSLPLERVVASLPDSVRNRMPGEAAGVLALDLAVEGEAGPERTPEVSGRMELREGVLRDRDGGTLADGVRGSGLLEGDTAVLRELAGEAFDGSFAARGRLVLDSLRRFELDIDADPRLDPLLRSGRDTAGLRGTGTALLDVGLGGRLGRPATYRARGSVALRDARLRTRSLARPVLLPEADGRLEGTRLTWGPTLVVAGADTLETSGSLDDLPAVLLDEPGRVPVLEAVLRGRRLVLDSLRRSVTPDSLRYSRLAWARLGGRRPGGKTVDELASAADLDRPGPFPVRGRVQLELGELRHGFHRLTDVTATLTLSPERLRLDDARFGAYGGRAEASLELGLDSEAATPFRLALDVSGARGEELLGELSPLGRTLTGALTLDFRVAGRVDRRLLPETASVEGLADLGLSDGAVRENPVTRALSRSLRLPGLSGPTFRSLTSRLRLIDGRVELQEGSLTTPGAELRLGGDVGLDGTLGLAVIAAVPPAAVDTAALRGLGLAGDAARRLLAGDQPLEFGARLGGTVASPTVEVDLSAVRTRAAAAAGETLRERATREAGGLLRRLLGTPDTARTDTAARDTVAPAAEPDTSAVDSVGRDTTTAPDTTESSGSGPAGSLPR